MLAAFQSEFNRGDALLGLGDQVHGRNQVVSGTLVDAKMVPVVSGGLPPAGVALVEVPGTNDAMFVARALRTDESAWSAPVRERFATEFFSAVEGHETRLRETLLKLNPIPRHDHPPRSAHISADHGGFTKTYDGA